MALSMPENDINVRGIDEESSNQEMPIITNKITTATIGLRFSSNGIISGSWGSSQPEPPNEKETLLSQTPNQKQLAF